MVTDIAFIRVPKTGGTFFNLRTLPSKYQFSNIHLRVSEVNSIINENIPFFTMVRDPYDRACSEYFFIKSIVSIVYFSDLESSNEEGIQYVSNILMKNIGPKIYYDKTYFLYKNNMTIEDYLDYYYNFQTYPYYYDERLPKDFDALGITEHMQKTIDLLQAMYKIQNGNGKSNANPFGSGPHYETQYSRHNFKLRNSIEYEIYSESLDRFNTLCARYL